MNRFANWTDSAIMARYIELQALSANPELGIAQICLLGDMLNDARDELRIRGIIE